MAFEDIWKLLEKYNKAPKRKLVGKRYIVESKGAYFHFKYTTVEDMESNDGNLAHSPSVLCDKLKDPKRSAEALYLYLNTPTRCREFLAGKLIAIRDNPLGDSTGKNIKFGL